MLEEQKTWIIEQVNSKVIFVLFDVKCSKGNVLSLYNDVMRTENSKYYYTKTSTITWEYPDIKAFNSLKYAIGSGQ